jgi:hypothetical protein
MSLRDEIIAGGFDLTHRNDGAIAAALSVGRVKTVPTTIGVGSVLVTLGVGVGTMVLDSIYGQPSLKYVAKLLDAGTLRVDLQVTKDSIQALVPAVLTQEQAASLINIAVVPDIVTTQQVTDALEGM